MTPRRERGRRQTSSRRWWVREERRSASVSRTRCALTLVTCTELVALTPRKVAPSAHSRRRPDAVRRNRRHVRRARRLPAPSRVAPRRPLRGTRRRARARRPRASRDGTPLGASRRVRARRLCRGSVPVPVPLRATRAARRRARRGEVLGMGGPQDSVHVRRGGGPRHDPRARLRRERRPLAQEHPRARSTRTRLRHRPPRLRLQR